MELSQRLKQARLEAGMSQRQLCGDVITRNMLSQIENGSARPSMDTLRYLASQLGKPVSFFLEESFSPSPNQQLVEQAAAAYESGDFSRADALLRQYQQPDPSADREYGLLQFLTLLSLAETALTQHKLPYAATLLEQAEGCSSPYITPELQRRRLLLLAQVRPEQRSNILAQLPPDDRELLLRTEQALQAGDFAKAAALLEAAADRDSSRWHLLRGRTAFGQKQYSEAIEFFRLAETDYPQQTAPTLEQCYLQLGDYKMAYHYACIQRSGKP